MKCTFLLFILPFMVPEVLVKRSVPVPNINLVLGFPVFKLLRSSTEEE